MKFQSQLFSHTIITSYEYEIFDDEFNEYSFHEGMFVYYCQMIE